MKCQSQPETAPSRSRSQRGATLVEVLMASLIGTLALSALMVLVLAASQDQAWGLAEAQLHQEAGLLQDKLTRLLRQMSATESTVFADPTAHNSPFYRRIITAQGKAPAHPREEIIYSPAELSLVHDPNRSLNGDEAILHDASSPIKLRKAFFFPSVKPGGAPDTTSINVWLELDDNGAAGRRTRDGGESRTAVVRSFTVTMRNN